MLNIEERKTTPKLNWKLNKKQSTDICKVYLAKDKTKQWRKMVTATNEIISYRKDESDAWTTLIQPYEGDEITDIWTRVSKCEKASRVVIERELAKQNSVKINSAQKHRAKKNGVESTYTVDDWKECLQHFNNKCAKCGNGVNICQDHYIPIVLGGGYTKSNIIPLCIKCNSSKGMKQPERYFDKQVIEKIKKYFKMLENRSQNSL